jgi:predicted nucleic acid-binding protein
MTGSLLETSGYSAFRRGHSEIEIEPRVRSADSIAVNPVVLGELLAGFRRGGRRAENESTLRAFLDSPRVFVAETGKETALRYAEIYQSLRESGTPVPANDIWIAATAMEFGLVVLTTDSHFRKEKQILVECFSPS